MYKDIVGHANVAGESRRSKQIDDPGARLDWPALRPLQAMVRGVGRR